MERLRDIPMGKRRKHVYPPKDAAKARKEARDPKTRSTPDVPVVQEQSPVPGAQFIKKAAVANDLCDRCHERLVTQEHKRPDGSVLARRCAGPGCRIQPEELTDYGLAKHLRDHAVLKYLHGDPVVVSADPACKASIIVGAPHDRVAFIQFDPFDT